MSSSQVFLGKIEQFLDIQMYLVKYIFGKSIKTENNWPWY